MKINHMSYRMSPGRLFVEKNDSRFLAGNCSRSLSNPMDPYTSETRLMDLAARTRKPPPRYQPEPIVQKKKRERRKTYVPVKNYTPPFSKDQRERAAIFLDTQFGNGVENEEKYSRSVWYDYWNRFSRDDGGRSPSLEDRCFVCKEEFDIEEGDIPKVCGVSGCPKVYHRKCWDFFHCCKKFPLIKEEYYKFMENNTIASIEKVRSFVQSDSLSSDYFVDECICPWHTCQQCGLMACEGMSYCPTCPLAYCSSCLGGITAESYCRVCVRIPAVLNAPEMKISKFY